MIVWLSTTEQMSAIEQLSVKSSPLASFFPTANERPLNAELTLKIVEVEASAIEKEKPGQEQVRQPTGLWLSGSRSPLHG